MAALSSTLPARAAVVEDWSTPKSRGESVRMVSMALAHLEDARGAGGGDLIEAVSAAEGPGAGDSDEPSASATSDMRA